MTETVGTQSGGEPDAPESQQRERPTGRKLRIERVYTTEGAHPYDEVRWERRDVVMTNWRDGSVNFEQRGVEFPDFWSINSANIVTTKYFRGAVGTPEREWSLRQLIDRVVKTYRAAGERYGYFATSDDAEVFEQELTWMVLHQVFSFNSPVWFNVGTSAPQQVSACFILSVDDTMESILNWYREEGLIFKGGSGAGLNLSRIRSSKELLSSGGTASGPVSFMRGADASAGTIKSGGATRRAAKMVVLDVDHPDIAEFITTKAREEDKVRALRDAGFDMDLSGKDIVSVQYQNANNSVRVSDEFMEAVEHDTEFGLRARLSGELLQTVDARSLFHSMAQAAWECADPGIQYDDTINDWHTNPETGRITASNPCFPADQRVTTDKGLIRIGDLVTRAAAGETFDVYTDDVTNTDSPVSRIVASRPVGYLVTGTNEILELRFSDGSRLRCTPRHRLWTANRGWVHADELASDDQVVRSLHYADRPFADELLPARVLRSARTASGRPLAHPPEKWNEEFAYYLGWLVGDGCLTDQGAITVYGSEWAREHVLPRHREMLAWITGFASKPSVQANGTHQLRAYRKSFAGLLDGLGVSRGRSAEKVVPEAVFEAPEDALHAFLRGLYDADGCVMNQQAKGTRYVGLGSRSEELLLGVQELLASLGIRASLYTQVQKAGSFHYTRKDGTAVSYGSDGPSYDLRISGRHIQRFAEVVGFDHLDKAEKLDVLISSHSFCKKDETVRLTSRVSRGFEPTFNLTEPRNHSYVVSGIVVANCSEYLSLDNSSCNLASMNLLKFLREDGTFDAERFVRAVELVITAMDISICFADFPTEKIGETTRAYRQLGIGYANLGALLMATAHAYDSEGGRALAAAITSLMTGTAYRRSAELAGIVGQYDGYARNAQAHTRVMRKHAEASQAVRPVGADDARIRELANEQWAQCLRIGEQNGWRNAQASVLAPTGTIGLMMGCDTTGVEPDLALVKFKKLVGGGSMQFVNQTVPQALRFLGYQEEQIEAIVEHIAEHGHVVGAPGLNEKHYEVFDCAMGERSIAPMGHVRMMAAVQPFISGGISKCVVGDTLVASGDGLVRIGSLYQGESEDSFREELLEISSLDGYRKTDAFYYGGTRPVRRVRLRSGHSITGTHPHRLLTAGPQGLVWKSLGEITEGDAVAVQYGAELWSTVPADLRHVRVSASYGNQKRITLPTEMSEDLAFLLGAYASEGHTTRSTWTVTITNSVPDVLERVRRAWQAVFGVEARIDRQPDRCPGVVVASKSVVEFLEALGCGSRASNKRIPDAVLCSPRPMVLAFLRGLALDAYVTTSSSLPRWAICLDSPGLLDDLQSVMTNLGVRHSRVKKHNSTYGKDYSEVYAPGLQGQLMASLVPFLEPDKAARAAEFLDMSISSGTADVVPGITGRELYELIPRGKPGRGGVRGWRTEYCFLLDSRTAQVTRSTVERVSTLPGVVLPSWLRQVIDGNLHFSPVVEVTDAGSAPVYDLSVPETRAFVANGIMNHNTVNLPESATVEDIKQIYFESWKLGVKALAVYRDNCKVGQPLSTGTGAGSGSGSGTAGDAVRSVASELAAQASRASQSEARPVRRRLPKQRPSITTRFGVGGAEGYMTASSYPDDGLGEVFLKMSKQGSTLAGVMDAFSVAISIGLQYGVPLETYVRKFVNMRFDPAGMTDDPDIRIASSVVDYIFRRLALDFLSYDERAELGIFTASERADQVATSYDSSGQGNEDVDVEGLRTSAPLERASTRERARATETPVAPSVPETPAARPAAPSVGSSMELLEAKQGRSADAPLCFTCGTKMRPAGSCYVCEGCGSTSGCS